MNEIRRQKLTSFVERLNSAGHGGKTTIFKECAGCFGWSVQKAIRELKAAGYESSRKQRSDKGKTVVPEDALVKVAAIQKSGRTKNGKDTLHVTGAVAIAANCGETIPVSVGRMRQLLRDHKLDQKTLTKPAPYVHMRSLHPNHVHEVDPSLSRMYYAPKGIALINDAQANRNKVKGYERLKLWRYVLTDHYSGSVVIRYYETAGENQANLYDFLLYAWGVKSLSSYHFHGVPDILLMDSGSANISRAMKYALKALDVDAKPHGVEKPQVKGQVEKANNVAEVFEGFLRLQPQMTVEAINEYVELWCAAYNADTIPRYDSRLERNKRYINRLESWLTIKQNQLRELPSREVCWDLLTRDPKPVVVRGDLFVPFEGRLYSLAGLPGVYVGMNVFVQPLLMRNGNVIRVHYTNEQSEEISIVAAPLAIDDHSGFLMDSPVIGREYKAQKKTAPEKNVEQLDELIADPVAPFKGEVRALDALDGLTDDALRMPRAGLPIDISGGQVFDNIMTPVQAANHLKKRLGWWNAACMEHLQAQYSSGIKESELPLIESYLQGVSDDGIGSQTSVA